MIRIWIAALALLVGAQESELEKSGGGEFKFRVLMAADFKGDKPAVRAKVKAVIQDRLHKKGFLSPTVTCGEDDVVVVQLPGLPRAKMGEVRTFLGTMGKLELKRVAAVEIHEAYNRKKEVPAGYEKYVSTQAEADYPHIQDHVIVAKDAVITSDHIVQASSEEGPDGWEVHFKLGDAGAKLFDEAAADLFKQSPKGKIAIIIDGKLHSYPRVQTDSFCGAGRVTGGFEEQQATDLAIILRSGSLPFPLGRKTADGKFVEKEPESERYADKK